MSNKLTVEEQFLTSEQAKELQELGIDFSGSNTWFCKYSKDPKGNKVLKSTWKLVHSKSQLVVEFERFEYIPTLSVAEMLGMLPKCVEVKGDLYELYLKKGSFHIDYKAYELGYGGYLNELLCINKYIHTLLRDSLFEMLKWLKQNKLI